MMGMVTVGMIDKIEIFGLIYIDERKKY